MIEAVVEGGGVVVGLLLLFYFQIIRADRPAPSKEHRPDGPGRDQT